jgi:hypothetical protein
MEDINNGIKRFIYSKRILTGEVIKKKRMYHQEDII